VVAEIIDGEKLAEILKKEIKFELDSLKKSGVLPSLIALQIGDNPSSKIYVENQRNTCESLGVNYTVWTLSQNTTQEALEDHIRSLNTNPSIHGIIIQHPLPSHIDSIQTIQVMDPNKDVEGLHPLNYGRLFYEEHNLAPCTALAAERLLKYYEPDLKGKEVTIIGHSALVGKPLSMLLLSSKKNAPTVTTCHIGTRSLKEHTLRSDIVFVACGVPNLITADMIHKNSIIIDIGINRVAKTDAAGQVILNEKGKPSKKTVGDVDFAEVSKVCKAITPVPGGVGPVTVAMLLSNTVKCARLASKKKI
jgi:methylenetetrahydrofolate dehydrogenase (NADP+)/methenyltetrahydrofolate cyclohydrolase